MTSSGHVQEKAPRVTVLMAVYNGEKYLRESIDSILGQTFTDFEFLIVDDGSTDSSRAIICSFDDPRIRLVENIENLGLTKSLNRGLALARGEYVARQDADDISHPSRLAKQLVYLDKHMEVAVVGAQARFIDEYGKELNATGTEKATTNLSIQWQLMFDSPFVHTSVMFRTNIVREKYCGYDESFQTSQDFELWSRIAPDFQLGNLPEQLVSFRTHQKSVSASSYTRERVKRVEAILRNNVLNSLNDERIANDWPHLWDCIVNFKLWEEEEVNPNVSSLIEQMYSIYCSRHPEAENDSEIKRHLSSKFVIVSRYFAMKNASHSFKPLTLSLKYSQKFNLYPYAKILTLIILGNKFKLLKKFIKNAKHIGRTRGLQ